MRFRLNPQQGQPLYLQLVQQVRHAVETGLLRTGDGLPGIRTLAEELVVSHNTVAKAYSELEHEGVLEIRHGSGAYISSDRPEKSRLNRNRRAQERIRTCVQALERDGLSTQEIRRLVEAELFDSEERTPAGEP